MQSFKFIEINKLKIAYYVEGTGSPVVLLHGWGAEANTFNRVVEFLSANYQVYAFDLPGFGLSEMPPTAWDASDYAKLLLGCFEKLKIDRVNLIGHSYGGRISIVIAANEPHRVDKLILVNSAGIRPKRTFNYYLKINLAKIGRKIRNLGYLGNKLADVIVQSVGSKDYRDAGQMKGTMVKSVNQDLRPLLPRIKTSTLLVWGENDEDTPVSDGKTMEKEIPDAALVVFKDAGHFSYLDQFQQFTQIVSRFLD